MPTTIKPHIAIACGGTGGHLFPGIALAEQFLDWDCQVTLLISSKDIDQHVVKTLKGAEVVMLPAVGLTRGNFFGFVRGFLKSYGAARKFYKISKPDAAISMGGFTSAPPVMAAGAFGSKRFLHESNTIPGKANRWLAHWVDLGFVWFNESSGRLPMSKIEALGMPLRRTLLEKQEAAACRMAMGLAPGRPVLLIMGGSQGASGINQAVIDALPLLKEKMPELQYIHLTGVKLHDEVLAAYQKHGLKAAIRPFLTEMEYALGAATASISRSGASSLAEIAGFEVPSLLVPYPHAADDHQYYNGLLFEEAGAAWMERQHGLHAEKLTAMLHSLLSDETVRRTMQANLGKLAMREAAPRIAARILEEIGHAELVKKIEASDEEAWLKSAMESGALPSWKK